MTSDGYTGPMTTAEYDERCRTISAMAIKRFPCPHCKAPRGKACALPSGRRMAEAHAKRWHRARVVHDGG